MKIAGRERRNKPNFLVLEAMQLYSARGWVYREGQGWVFAELTPDELAEFKSYTYGITIPRMRVRLPYSQAIGIYQPKPDKYANWFIHCTMPQASPLALTHFKIDQVIDEPQRTSGVRQYPVGSYETWLWADEVEMCRELGCEVTVQGGWGWMEWGVPVEWKPPLTKPRRSQRKEHTFIYALVDEITQEVRYIGKADDPNRRLLDHLRDISNPAKWAWIQSLEVQSRKPKLNILEEVAVADEFKRERYWILYYWKHGHNLTNAICRDWHKPKDISSRPGTFFMLAGESSPGEKRAIASRSTSVMQRTIKGHLADAD